MQSLGWYAQYGTRCANVQVPMDQGYKDEIWQQGSRREFRYFLGCIHKSLSDATFIHLLFT